LDNQSPLDMKIIETLRALQPKGAPDVLGELIDMFIQNVPPQIERIRVAIQQGDSETLYKTAHALKGNSASIGAVRLADHASELEQNGRMQNLQDATQSVERIEQEFTRAVNALEQQRKR
jgi:two-component system, sensor histidine kinase and response regulator